MKILKLTKKLHRRKGGVFKKTPVRRTRQKSRGSSLIVHLGKFTEKTMTDEYNEYMLSDEWAAMRKVAIRAAGGRCRFCNSPYNLEVHHRTYVRFGHESPEDVTVVCHECHVIFHLYRRIYQF